MVLRKGGAIDALAGIVRRAFVEHGESTTTEPTLIIALVGLLNLSLHVDNQVPIAHKSLAMLLRFHISVAEEWRPAPPVLRGRRRSNKEGPGIQ